MKGSVETSGVHSMITHHHAGCPVWSMSSLLRLTATQLPEPIPESSPDLATHSPGRPRGSSHTRPSGRSRAVSLHTAA